MSPDRLSALFFLALSVGYGALAYQIELFPGSEYEAFTARTLPLGLAAAGAVVSLLMLVLPSESTTPSWRGYRWGLALALCGLMLLYGFSITRLGFVVSTSLFLIIGIFLLGERRWTVILGLSLPVSIGFWLILTQGLDIYLEPGWLF